MTMSVYSALRELRCESLLMLQSEARRRDSAIAELQQYRNHSYMSKYKGGDLAWITGL